MSTPPPEVPAAEPRPENDPADLSSTAHHPPLTPADVVADARTGLAPVAVGLGVALATSVVLLVVGFIGAALAGSGSPGDAVSGTAAEDLDLGNLLTLLLLPFQVLGAGLLGTLHVSAGDVTGSLYLPPLWVTAAYVVGVALTARRGTPHPGHHLRRTLAGAVATGAATAVVVTVAMWALALRSDGVTIHTASASLFVGTLALTTGALTAGRWSGRWHPGVDLDVVAAARLLWSVLVAWLVVGVPLLALVLLVAEGLGVALVTLTLAPTVAVGLLELAHLGAYSAAGEQASAFSGNAVVAVLLPLAGLVSLLLTSVAWHLRRPTPPGATARSWVVLPLVALGGGVALLLGGLVVVGGGISGFLGGTLTIAPAFWTLPLFLVWGVVAEALSRYVAPSVAPALPDVLTRRLDHRRPLHVGDDAGAAVAASAVPRTEEQRRRDRSVLLVAGGALGALVVVALAWSFVSARFFGPEGAARDYLDAVSQGDVDRALELAPLDYADDDVLHVTTKYTSDDAATDLLDAEVYRAAERHVTGYEIVGSDVNGDTATLDLRLEGVDDARAELVLVRDGHRFGVFPRWKVTEAGLAQAVFSPLDESAVEGGGSGAGSEGGVTVNGVAVDLEPGRDQWALPGTYAIDPYADNPFLESSDDPIEVSADGAPAMGSFAARPTVSDEFRRQLQEQVDAYLERCLASTELEPDGCPQASYEYGDVRKVRWSLDEAPSADLEYVDTAWPTTIYLSGGSASVRYESDESYGYGPRQWRPASDTSSLDFAVEVDAEGDRLVVTPQP